MALAVVLLWLVASMQAATPADSAAFAAFEQTDRELTHFSLLQRTGVTEDLDLVIAMGSSKALPITQTPMIGWSQEQKIGLFLQEKALPAQVYSLGTKSGFEDCAMRIERVTITDAVISCEGEKVGRYVTQKWIYDVRAKKVLEQFSYRPFAMHRIFPSAGGAVFVGSDAPRLIAVGFTAGRDPEFQVLSDLESAPWLKQVQVLEGTAGGERILHIQPEPIRTLRFGPSAAFQLLQEDAAPRLAIVERSGMRIRPYPLPQSTYNEFAAARPGKVKDGYVREQTGIEEQIGPWKVEKDKLWFGKTLYDGEGRTGVGGFGYFDAADRKYHLFSPPEIAGWSVSAIDIAADAVWMALVANGEYGGSSGGLLRYDRKSSAVHRFEFPDIGVQFIRVGGKLLAATDFGIAVVEGDGVKRYFVDRTGDGRLRVAPAVC